MQEPSFFKVPDWMIVFYNCTTWLVMDIVSACIRGAVLLSGSSFSATCQAERTLNGVISAVPVIHLHISINCADILYACRTTMISQSFLLCHHMVEVGSSLVQDTVAS